RTIRSVRCRKGLGASTACDSSVWLHATSIANRSPRRRKGLWASTAPPWWPLRLRCRAVGAPSPLQHRSSGRVSERRCISGLAFADGDVPELRREGLGGRLRRDSAGEAATHGGAVEAHRAPRGVAPRVGSRARKRTSSLRTALRLRGSGTERRNEKGRIARPRFVVGEASSISAPR